MDREGFQANFVCDAYDKEEMWYLVEEQIFQQNLIEDRYDFNGRKYKLDKVGDAVLRHHRDSFEVESGPLKFYFSPSKTLGYDFLDIVDKVNSSMNWNHWVERFAQRPGFFQAFSYDENYRYWQGAYDLDTYERHGRSHAHLRKRKRRMPEPLDNLIIAIEDNPGRYVIRTEHEKQIGFVETVTAEMWLGPEFWPRTGADRDAVLNCEFLQVEEMEHDIIHIQTGYRTFTEDTGEQAELQNKMRRLLYPNTVDMPLRF